MLAKWIRRLARNFAHYLFQLMHAWLQVARARSSTPSSTM
ncbi:transposase [Xanthomonas oryzae pv. oryzae PXO99A]|uniref:Transposase n=1 Tax=Xanthomonas oryzae pv. oryzae (strain PXO99A) TaxID=360094 RepID=A0A0K0GKL4_XANOP|nr:transposase [Xanthomonas oryzae pv. oryzae PXO99A]